MPARAGMDGTNAGRVSRPAPKALRGGAIYRPAEAVAIAAKVASGLGTLTSRACDAT